MVVYILQNYICMQKKLNCCSRSLNNIPATHCHHNNHTFKNQLYLQGKWLRKKVFGGKDYCYRREQEGCAKGAKALHIMIRLLVVLVLLLEEKTNPATRAKGSAAALILVCSKYFHTGQGIHLGK